MKVLNAEVQGRALSAYEANHQCVIASLRDQDVFEFATPVRDVVGLKVKLANECFQWFDRRGDDLGVRNAVGEVYSCVVGRASCDSQSWVLGTSADRKFRFASVVLRHRCGGG